jgi:hypothetical protein
MLPAATRLAIPWKPGLKFGLDAIPISISHRPPPLFLMIGTDYGGPSAYLKNQK